MLTVRDRQIDSLKSDAQRRFTTALSKALYAGFPELFGMWTPAQLEQHVETRIAFAGRYGLADEADVERLARCECAAGVDVTRLPPDHWMLDILQDDATGPQKAARLEAIVYHLEVHPDYRPLEVEP